MARAALICRADHARSGAGKTELRALKPGRIVRSQTSGAFRQLSFIEGTTFGPRCVENGVVRSNLDAPRPHE
jgi:hypothetical protein